MNGSQVEGDPCRAEFRVLGPLEVLADGRLIRLGKRERTVLAVLILSANRVVPADRLIDSLWAGSPPEAADRVLRVYVHRLRKALAECGAGGAVETSPPGYRLRVDPDALDVARFEAGLRIGRQQAAAGDHQRASATLSRTLRLWRGPLLADLAEADFVSVEAARLDAARLGALEDRLDCDLHSGRHRAVLPELEALTLQHPLRERLWWQRMLALYRSGRQAEALGVYQQARQHLLDELGLDPGPSLVELEAAILRQETYLLPPPPAPAPTVPLPPELAAESARPFVGREADLDRVEQLVFDPARRRMAVIWLLGEPGIGKTRLAREIARRAHRRGATVLFGWNSEDLAVPYQPVIEALRWLAAHVPDEELPGRLGAFPGELVRLASELGERLGGAGPSRSTSPEVEQYQLFEAVRSWWGSQADRVSVIVLDDLQWAGHPTLALLGHAARHAGPSGAALVCTARTTSPDDNEALAFLAEDLERRGVPTLRVVLGGLPVEAVDDLVMAAAGRPFDAHLGRLAARLREETAGNPLFLDGLLAGLAADDSTLSPDWLPVSLAETVTRRVARLPGEVGDLLRVAAVTGLDFDLAVVALAAGRPELDVVDALEGAVHAGLVEEAGPDRYRFAHSLVRSALRQQLSPSRRVRVHRRVGEAIETLHADDLETRAAELAHHFFEALPGDTAARAQTYSMMAAERNTRLLSHHEAADAYRCALDLLEATAGRSADEQIELALRLSRAEFRAGRFAAARGTLRRAADVAAFCGSPSQLGRIATAFDDASSHIGYGGTDSLHLLEQAASALPAKDTPLRARILAAIARALRFEGRRSESMERADEALAIARRLGDPATIAAVLLRTLYAYKGLDRPVELMEQAVELTSLAWQLGDDELYLFGLFALDDAAAVLGAVSLWDAILAEQRRLVTMIRQPYLEHDLWLRAQLRAAVAGNLAEAEDCLERARPIAAELGWGLDGLYSLVTFLLRREQGRLVGLGPAVSHTVRRSSGVWGPGLAALYVEVGELDEARLVFGRLADDRFAGLPHDDTRPMCLGLMADVCVALDDGEHARALLEELRPSEGRLLILVGMAACLGPVDRLLGRLAFVAGDRDGARRWSERALALARNLTSPLWTAYCLHDLALHIAADDPEAGSGLLDEAAALCAGRPLLRVASQITSARQSIAGR